MKKVLIPILSFFLFVGALRAQPMDDHTFAQQYQLARVYEETRDLPNAIRLYAELHKARPDFGEVSEGLFRGLFMLKRYDEAETLLVERLSKEPETFELEMNLARVRSKLNKKSQALEAFAHAEKAGKDIGHFSATLMIAQTMMEVGYQEEALELLLRERKNSEDGDQFTREIASLYFKLGKYEEGTKEYLAMLKANDQNLSLVQQRIAQFTADTSVRSTIIKIVTSHIDIDNATPAELRLLGWCYGELKNYKGALRIILKLDNLDIKSSSSSAGGYELYQFAERIRNEGALDVAVMAYTEAIRRFREGAANDPQRKYFVSMAELGFLKTKEAYLRSIPDVPADSLVRITADYQNYAKTQAQNDLALDALLHGGELAFHVVHDYANAQFLYENLLARAQGFSPGARDAYFALEEIALAQNELATAELRLDLISGVIEKRKRPDDAEIARHILLERAKIDYFNGLFDSSLAKLEVIMAEPGSDYANDAIALHTLITENRGNNAALKLFAKAELMGLGKDLNAALSAYRSIPETYPTATISDESVLRAVEMEIQLKKPSDALSLLAMMQEKMPTSPLLDKAAFRQAEITETLMKEKAKAQRMYEDFLERYPKSPLGSEARKKARALRGDSF